MISPFRFWTEEFEQLPQGIVKFIYHALLQGNNRVISNSDVFGTHFGAALRNIAIPDSARLLQFGQAIFGVQRVHLQRCSENKKARSDKFLVQMMISQNMADILAKEAFDALAKFLDPINI
jgi:hypothetical protein